MKKKSSDRVEASGAVGVGEEKVGEVWGRWVWPTLAVGLMIGVYLPGLGGGSLLWDDDRYLDVASNAALRPGWLGLWAAWFQTFDASWYPILQTYLWGMARIAESLGKPLVTVVKWGNLYLGVGSLFLFASILWRASEGVGLSRGEGQGFRAMVWMLGLWIWLHPLRIETVVWASNVRDSLSVFFLLGAWALYLRPRPWWMGAFGLAILAVLSKTALVLVPLLFPWLRVVWLSQGARKASTTAEPAKERGRREKGGRKAWGAALEASGSAKKASGEAGLEASGSAAVGAWDVRVWGVIWGGVALGLLLATAAIYQGHEARAERCHLADTWAGHVAAVACVQGRLFLRVWSWDVPLPIPPMPEACLWPAVGGLALLIFLAFGVAALWGWKSPKQGVRIGAVVVAWCFLALLPVSGVIPLHFPIAERYSFLPMIGLAWGVGLFGLCVWGGGLFGLRVWGGGLPRPAGWRSVPWVFLFGGVGLGFLAFQTRQAIPVWNDSLHLWKVNHAASPKEWAVLVNLAGAFGAKARFSEARQVLEKAATLAPDRWVIQRGLFLARALEGLPPAQAIRLMQIFQMSSASPERLAKFLRFPLLRSNPPLSSLVLARKRFLESKVSRDALCAEERRRWRRAGRPLR